MNNRITLSDYIQNDFFQLPKIFFDKNSRYFKMSLNAKTLYALLKNRLELSRKNNWVNEDGEIYLIMTRLEAAELIGIGETSARKAFHELEQMGLIEDVRQGLTKPNLIFINRFITEGNSSEFSAPLNSDGRQTQNLTASKNESSKNENLKEISKEKNADPQNDISENLERESNSNVIVINKKEAIDRIYKAYPCKKGKVKGYEYALAYISKGRKIAGFGNIKLSHEEIYCAVRHYAITCEKNETQPEFIKHFSTFMNKDVIEYAELAKECGYDDYMAERYGSDWKKIRFVYRD